MNEPLSIARTGSSIVFGLRMDHAAYLMQTDCYGNIDRSDFIATGSTAPGTGTGNMHTAYANMKPINAYHDFPTLEEKAEQALCNQAPFADVGTEGDI